jgi:hypothetical protein
MICALQTLTIKARSTESARGLLDALSMFHPELVEGEDGGQSVVVDLGNDRDIIAVLNALERCVSDRADGPVPLELEGRTYTMHPAEDSAIEE